ncbi:hypothetical protein BH23GEM11_BH23GEM11_02610 [soil metagenome]
MSGKRQEPGGTPRYRAAILDMDGVVTRASRLHATAWKGVFDEFLEGWGVRSGEERGFDPFDIDADYREFVDGKPRLDGARSFLASRAIELPVGSDADPDGTASLHGLGNLKNARFHRLLEKEGVEVVPGAVERLKDWKKAGLRIALVTSSRNGALVLEAAGLTSLFEVVLDGVEAAEMRLSGKPAPDLFLEAARRLGVGPEEAFVVEDAVAGVEAARAGNFGLVVGVAEHGDGSLVSRGADVVVHSLGDLDLASLAGGAGQARARHRRVGDHLEEVLARMARGRLALFLDYDGTLAPIVSHPEDATLSTGRRELLELLADRATVAIVSGRDLADVQDMVGLVDLHYAGSHGFDIAGPDGLRMQHEEARDRSSELDEAEADLVRALAEVEGARVERKRFAIAIHYRNVLDAEVHRVEAAVDHAFEGRSGLRRKRGKKIFELQPDVDWDKGQAVLWLLEQLGLSGPDVLPVYIGDDVTDEDAFETLKDTGLGIRVGPEDEETLADFTLPDPDALEAFLRTLTERLEPRRVPASRRTGCGVPGRKGGFPPDEPASGHP